MKGDDKRKLLDMAELWKKQAQEAEKKTKRPKSE